MDRNKLACVEVAVALPADGTFSYLVPAHLADSALVGCRVIVPFGKRRVGGYIIGPGDTAIDGELKEILSVEDPYPLFPESMVPFFRWLHQYYIHPLGQVIQSCLPSGLKRKVYRVARITEKGVEHLRQRLVSEKDREILEAVVKRPDKPIACQLDTIKHLEVQGLITLEEKVKPSIGPLMRTFIAFKEGSKGPSAKEVGVFRAKNEAQFLELVRERGPVLFSHLRKRFSNAAYLTNKWVKKGVIETFKAPVPRALEGSVFHTMKRPESLSYHQEQAIEKILKLLEKGRFATCLLFGITGSGKTEVYLEAINRIVELGKQAIVLVPEIALAIYMESVFQTRVKGKVGVYHSGLSYGERYDQWMRMVKGEVDVVIGARSALFAPFSRLGLIVVDEEHDSAYKQDRAPYYHGRDAAVARGRLEDALVILGSGTPSIQSYANCTEGRYHLIIMPQRVENRQFPEVEIVDMKELGETGTNRILSPRLLEALEENLQRNKQSMIFLNRRGFFRLFVCRFCGSVLTCPNCNVSLIYHLHLNRLVCHYCGFQEGPQERCPKCNRAGLKSWGFGTERLEHELKDRFPRARIARMDTDAARRKGKAQAILKDFINHDINILVGTQMITKGYDVPEVTLVGVVDADFSLGFPDFRAAERTFQILSQVAGRAGRGSERGKVIIQTYNPSHYAIQAAVSQDYKALYEKEIQLREQLGFPPFAYLVSLKLQGNSRENTERAAKQLGERLRKTLKKWPKKGKQIAVLGPVEAPIAKLRGKHRWQILIKAPRPYLAQELLRVAKKSSEYDFKSKGVQLILDVDPYQMM